MNYGLHETLSETIDHVKLAQQTIISSMIDDAVSLCELENWKNWQVLHFSLSQHGKKNIQQRFLNLEKNHCYDLAKRL